MLSIVFAVLIAVPLTQVSGQVDYRKEINVGSSALWVEVVDGKAYVTNPLDGTIVVIDENSDKVVGTIDAGKGVILFAVAQDKNKLYATYDSQNTVSVFNLNTLQKINDISLGPSQINQYNNAHLWETEQPYVSFQTSGGGLAYDSKNQMLYVIHAGTNSISVIDTTKDLVVGTIPVGITPVLIQIYNETNTGYVTNWESNDVTVIDLNSNKVIGDLRVGSVPDQMAIDPVNKRLYVTNHASPNVSVIDLTNNSVLTQIKLKAPTHSIAYNSKNGIMAITYTPASPVTASSFVDRVELVDTKTNTLVGGYDIVANPFSTAIDSDNQKLYATIFTNGTVIALNLAADPRYAQALGQTSQTVPEFGPLAALVLVASIISVITISSKTGFKFVPKY
ncbi:MAG: hypothetical protein KGI27_05115 [Thaumarchaeota archaeon]|nr:hypothetical protein [Nitrososphaerota archaeon]